MPIVMKYELRLNYVDLKPKRLLILAFNRVSRVTQQVYSNK